MKKPVVKNSIKSYFNFSARERKGSLVLTSIIIFQLLLIIFFHNRQSTFPDLPISTKLTHDTTVASKVMFRFNPNQLNDSIANVLPLPLKLSHTILNYISKGGKFKS